MKHEVTIHLSRVHHRIPPAIMLLLLAGLMYFSVHIGSIVMEILLGSLWFCVFVSLVVRYSKENPPKVMTLGEAREYISKLEELEK